MPAHFLPVACAAVALLAAALPLQAGENVTFRMADGRTTTGEVVEVVTTPPNPHFVVVVAGRRTNLLFSDLTPRSVYEGRSVLAAPDDAGVHIALGLYCLEHDMPLEAEREFTQAREAADRFERQAGELLDRARVSAAHATWEKAQRLEQGGQHAEALRLYEHIWSNYPDVEDIRDPLRGAIIALRQAMFNDSRLPPVIPRPDAGNDDPGGNPDPAGNNPGGNNGQNGNGEADGFDRTEDLERSQRRHYDNFREKLEHVREMQVEATAHMNEGQRMEVEGNQGGVQRAYQQADEKLVDALRLMDEEVIPDLRDYMPLGRRQAEATRGAIIELITRLARTQMHYWAQQRGHRHYVRNTSMWVARLLSLNPDDEEARRVRMILTEASLQQR